MAEMEGFESRLKSISGGDGSCSIAFSHYEPAPNEVQQRLAREHAGKRGRAVRPHRRDRSAPPRAGLFLEISGQRWPAGLRSRRSSAPWQRPG
ncbi:MAG: hypothetical protein IPJ73_16285 [Zoogloea sp.]|nr:hypothetical protein [Zoogloea sp.]